MLVFGSSSFGASLTFSRNARTYELQNSTLLTKSLAFSCLALTELPDGLPCNPAMTSFAKKSGLGVQGLLSNGYSSLSSISQLIDNKVSQELIDGLFTEGQIVQVEVASDIRFFSKYFNGQFTPLSVKGFSAVRNEANPDVDLYAIEQSGFLFQSGLEAFDNFFLGLQARTHTRKFIKQRFKLTQLGTSEGEDLLKSKEQIVTYFEPGFAYFFAGKWKPRVSGFLANTGIVSEKFSELKEPSEFQFALGISPPVWWGNLDLTLDFKSLSYDEEGARKLRLGTLYSFGSMYLSGGIDAAGLSTGIFYSLDKINAGVVYSSTNFFQKESEFYTQTVYVQLGWQI